MYKRKAIYSILVAAVITVLLFAGHTTLAQESTLTGRIVNCVNSVNVRKGPGTKYAKVGVAPKDTVYPVLGVDRHYLLRL